MCSKITVIFLRWGWIFCYGRCVLTFWSLWKWSSPLECSSLAFTRQFLTIQTSIKCQLNVGLLCSHLQQRQWARRLLAHYSILVLYMELTTTRYFLKYLFILLLFYYVILLDFNLHWSMKFICLVHSSILKQYNADWCLWTFKKYLPNKLIIELYIVTYTDIVTLVSVTQGRNHLENSENVDSAHQHDVSEIRLICFLC